MSDNLQTTPIKIIKKRNGASVPFDVNKIISAANRAYAEVNENMTDVVRNKILEHKFTQAQNVDDINEILENILYHHASKRVYDAFSKYRTERTAMRKAITGIDKAIAGISDGSNEYTIMENSNKDAKINSSRRDLSAGEYSKEYARRNMMPSELMDAHDLGLIHFHDLDYALIHTMFNCCLINLKDMFENGTVVNGWTIETPKSIRTAATVASQIILQVSNNQYGGCTIDISHLAPYVSVTREKWQNTFKNSGIENWEECAEKETWNDITNAMQTIQYQLNTFSSLNGQSPFCSIFMWLDEKDPYIDDTALLIKATLLQRIQGIKNDAGVWTTPSFPKLLFVLDDNNLKEGSKYYYLKKLAIKSTSKRMNPDYMSAKMLRQTREGQVFGCMGCRSLLSPWRDSQGNYKFWGRFNRGVVSINLPDAALTSKKENRDFFEVLDERLELCLKGLKLRDKWLRNASPDVSPIHWRHGALARLKGETINELLDGGYSTISLGYIGLAETIEILYGTKLSTQEGHEEGMKIMKYLNGYCQTHKTEPGLNGLSLYGTPAESLCYRFAKTIIKRFGEIPGIVEKGKMWLTNSYHVSPLDQVNAFEKIDYEKDMQLETLGGSISYVELPVMEDNLEALESLVDYAYDNLIYFECNTRSGDSCANCGYEGEIKYKNGHWTCPNCGETDHKKLTIVRRTCGYIGQNLWNQGKTEEINARVLHL